MDTLIDGIVAAVVTTKFRKTVACDELVINQVKKRVRSEAMTLFKQHKSHLDIILNLKERLQAIFHGEKLLCDTMQKKPAKVRKLFGYSNM